MRMAIKSLYFLLALLAPELLVAMAAQDHLSARKVKRMFKDGSFTLTHGFFANMGGFQIRIVDHAGDGTERLVEQFACEGQGLHELVERQCLTIPDITDDEIKDRSKADSLVYAIALWHIFWMLLQVIARWAKHLPLALIEVNALAFIVCGIFTYSLLWWKPQDVQCPIILRVNRETFDREMNNNIRDVLNQHARMAGQDSYRRSHIPYTTRSLTDMLWVGLLTAAAFNALHCIAWDYTFPTPAEQWIWRTASIVAIGVSALSFVIAEAAYMEWLTLGMITKVAMFLCLPIYVGARLCLVVLTFSSLRAVPADIYTSPSWVNSIIHIH
ncbi:hypothetical protein N431DRAFT_463354 [Stipitochalara longipes BDJ]|nr:hypothetical protein N431DRAFT_463354 [Stipitochalara longipes BDJ]